jgi:hypothetical protein
MAASLTPYISANFKLTLSMVAALSFIVSTIRFIDRVSVILITGPLFVSTGFASVFGVSVFVISGTLVSLGWLLHPIATNSTANKQAEITWVSFFIKGVSIYNLGVKINKCSIIIKQIQISVICNKLALQRAHLKLSEGLPTLCRFFSNKKYLKKGWQPFVELSFP